MAESSWPSPAAGRVVDDVSWEKLAINFGKSAGVYGDFTSPQLVYGDSTGMQIKVASDRYAHVRGHEWWSGSSVVTKTIAANSSGSTRIDLVVLRLSRTTWDVALTIVPGTPGAGAPAATQNLGTTGSYDLVLAEVTVVNSASTITAGNVNYGATHIGSNGQLRVPNTGIGFTYVPDKYPGMQVTSDASNIYTRTAANDAFVLAGQTGQAAFTPTLTASTTNPTMGTGASRLGWYTYLPGKLVAYAFQISFGSSGAAPGSGSYAISLPVVAGGPTGSGIQAVGCCQLADASSGVFKVATCWIGVGAITLGMVGDNPVNQGYPWAWSNGDYLAGQLVYPI